MQIQPPKHVAKGPLSQKQPPSQYEVHEPQEKRQSFTETQDI
ncbi:MAG: hypothetical protein ACPL3C_12685 [Pyrobaculum sp.]